VELLHQAAGAYGVLVDLHRATSTVTTMRSL